MAQYRYQIFIPGGNKTALVLGIDGLENDIALRKTIQDRIMEKHEKDADGEVEQVGFISIDRSAPCVINEPQLIMTGGEFCGNATRCAVAYYFHPETGGVGAGEIEIKVSGTQKPIKAGLSPNRMNYDAWAEMPLIEDLSKAIIPLRGGVYWVSIEGISHLVVPQVRSISYLNSIYSCESKNKQKDIALDFLKKIINENNLTSGSACGVIFLENIVDAIKMHPFVWCVDAGTTYYETACGSGAICVGLINSISSGVSVNIPLLQPSGKIIRAEVDVSSDDKLIRGKISGEIEIGQIFEVEC